MFAQSTLAQFRGDDLADPFSLLRLQRDDAKLIQYRHKLRVPFDKHIAQKRL